MARELYALPGREAADQVALEAALAAMVRATRRFAERQRTWFRAEAAVVWRHPEFDRTRIVTEAAAFLSGGARPDAAPA